MVIDRLFETKPDQLRYVLNRVVSILSEEVQFDYLLALELGGVGLVSMISMTIKNSFLIMRRLSKEYGTKQLIEGAFDENKRVLWVTDRVTQDKLSYVNEICAQSSLSVSGIISVFNVDTDVDTTIPISSLGVDAK